MITPENDIAPSKFEQPPKEPFIVLEDEDLVIIKNLIDEEESKKDLSLFENSLDENGIKADCFEKDIKNVITQHDKIHS
jgi:hypothetical protein